MYCVTYARVSSKDQETEGYSIPSQIKLLKKYARKNNLKIVQEFIEVESAKKSGRYNFDKMLSYIKSNPGVKNILVEKTDRLYRNIFDFAKISKLDIDVHLIKENEIYGKNSRSNEKFFQGIRMLMAAHYSDNLSEEAQKGMLEKAEQGGWPCKAPIGYKRNVENHELELDASKSFYIKKIFEEYATGMNSIAKLADSFYLIGLRSINGKRINKAGIHRILKNPIYCGKFIYKGKIYKGKHVPIISMELYHKVQEVLAKGTSPHISKRNFAYRGFLKCHKCGCSITPEIKKEKYIYYSCTQYRGKCRNSIREDRLVELFIDVVKRITINPSLHEWLIKALKESHQEKEKYHTDIFNNLKKRYAQVKNRIEKAYQDKLDGLISDDFWKCNFEKWNTELIEIESQIAIHRNANKEYLDLGFKILELANSATDLFLSRNNYERRKLLDVLLSNCSIFDAILYPTYRKPFDILAKGSPRFIKRG